jgi:hypothetical protein
MIAIAALAAISACGQSTTTTETPDTTVQTQPMAPAPTVVVLSEGDARTRAEGAGYTNITGLVQNPDGSWSATGTKDNATTQITIGENGVTATTTTTTTP